MRVRVIYDLSSPHPIPNYLQHCFMRSVGYSGQIQHLLFGSCSVGWRQCLLVPLLVAHLLPHLSYLCHIQTFHLRCAFPIFKVENMSSVLELQLSLPAIDCWRSPKN